MKKRKILSLLLSLCLLIGLLPTAALAADQTNAGAGIRIQYVDGSYDKTTGIMKVRVQAKMPAGTGITTIGTLLSYDNTKLAVVNQYKTTQDLTAPDGTLIAPAAATVKAIMTTESAYGAAGAYSVANGDIYSSGNRSALYTYLYNASPDVNKPTDAQTGGNWFDVCEVMFRVTGKPADPATVLNSDSLRIADVAKGDDAVMKGVFPANDIYSIYLTDNSDPARLYVLNRMSGCTATEVTGEKSLMTAPETGTATYPGSTNSPSATTKTLSSIAVTTAPTKTTYTAGENFDPAGMVVTATYSDGSTAAVTTYTVTDGNSLTAGKTSVTISYTEGSETKTCTQAITVKVAPKTLSSIAVTTAPTKTTYTAGEDFDPAGMVVTATYSDTTTAAVTGYTVTDGTALTAGKTSVTISYTEGGVTKTTTQAITVNAAPPAPTEYTITFDVNGGIGTIPSQTTSGQKLSSLPTATHSGSYSFDGWYTAASGGTQITTAYVFSANTTVYAHWTYTGGSVGVGSYTPSYSVSVDKTENGTITVSPKSASKGSIVTITVKPDKGYTLETLRALDMSGYAMELTENNGRFTFKMPASAVIVKATFMDDNTMLNFFVDVKASDYFYDAVLWAAEKGVTSGADALHFNPNAPCTRAQIVTFLWRAAGSPAPKNMSSFADVPADAFYAKAVAWAVENGITGGTGDGKFSPDATCTRAQAVTFLYRASGAPAVSGNAAFSDVATNAYYAAAVKWAEKNGITGGIGGGLFGSNNNCTRAQIVTFLYRSVK